MPYVELSFRGNLSNLQIEQRDILVRSIDQYLEWRNNKNMPDSRGYPLGWFTWARHYTSFGIKRAYSLKTKLKEYCHSNIIEPFRHHLENNSKLNNHSLDLYLLENVLKNRKLFLIPDNFQDLKSMDSRVRLRNSIKNQEYLSKEEFSYRVAQEFECDRTNQNHLAKAIGFYLDALQIGYKPALKALIRLADKKNADAQYTLGIYYHQLNDFSEAIKWYMQAADLNHQKAIDYLNASKFQINDNLEIAKRYLEGNGIKQNILAAEIFYKKAFEQKSGFAGYRLANLYDPTLKENFLKKDAKKAFNYYSKSARYGFEASITAMKNLKDSIDSNELTFSIGQFYFETNEYKLAYDCFKKLSNESFLSVIEELNKLIAENPHYCKIIAQLYEENNTQDHNIQNACMYYAVLFQKGSDNTVKQNALTRFAAHLEGPQISREEINELGEIFKKGLNGITQDFSKAKDCFELACKKGLPNAYFNLGDLFEHGNGVKQSLVNAVSYYQTAFDRGFVDAHLNIQKILHSLELTASVAFEIAENYRKGSETIGIDFSNAIKFYERASQLGHPGAASNLGQIYQTEHKGTEKNSKLAFSSYIRAAELGNKDVLKPLERLAEDASPDDQLKLSNLYSSFFKNNEKAKYWESKAAEISAFSFNI